MQVSDIHSWLKQMAPDLSSAPEAAQQSEKSFAQQNPLAQALSSAVTLKDQRRRRSFSDWKALHVNTLQQERENTNFAEFALSPLGLFVSPKEINFANGKITEHSDAVSEMHRSLSAKYGDIGCSSGKSSDKSDFRKLMDLIKINKVKSNPKISGLFVINPIFKETAVAPIRKTLLAANMNELSSIYNDPRLRDVHLRPLDDETKHLRILKAMTCFQLGIAGRVNGGSAERGTLPHAVRMTYLDEAAALHFTPWRAADAIRWRLKETSDKGEALEKIDQLIHLGAPPQFTAKALAVVTKRDDLTAHERPKLEAFAEFLDTAKSGKDDPTSVADQCANLYSRVSEQVPAAASMIRSWILEFHANGNPALLHI